MSDQDRTIPKRPTDAHRKSWYVHSGVATCIAPGCDWSAFGTITQTDRSHARHVAALQDFEDDEQRLGWRTV